MKLEDLREKAYYRLKIKGIDGWRSYRILKNNKDAKLLTIIDYFPGAVKDPIEFDVPYKDVLGWAKDDAMRGVR